MSNPFIPNSTPTPNIILDEWMFQLSNAEFKVLMCICRKTYGWHKEKDQISLKQIEKMTGLSRRGITQNLDSLLKYGLILKIKSKTSDGDDAANQYMINVNCMVPGSEIDSPPVVNSVHHGVVNSVHPQKKLYTKETNTKEREATPSHSPNSLIEDHINNQLESLDQNANGQTLQHNIHYRTTNSEHDNNKIIKNNDNNKDIISSSKLSIERKVHVSTTQQEHETLLNKISSSDLERAYQILSDWKQDTPRSKWKKNDYRSILRWVIDALKESGKKSNPISVHPIPENTDKIERYRRHIIAFIKKNWEKMRSKDQWVSDHVTYVCVGVVKIEYNDPKFKEKLAKEMRAIGYEP